MATQLKKGSNTITADGDYFWAVRPYQEATVKIKFTTAGSGGTIALNDNQGDPYLDKNDAEITLAYSATDGIGHAVMPTGGHLNFTAASFAGSPVVEVNVIQAPSP